MVKFELIPNGNKFGYRGNVWIKTQPFDNGSGGKANAYRADVPDPGNLLAEEIACVDSITLVTELEQ